MVYMTLSVEKMLALDRKFNVKDRFQIYPVCWIVQPFPKTHHKYDVYFKKQYSYKNEAVMYNLVVGTFWGLPGRMTTYKLVMPVQRVAKM